MKILWQNRDPNTHTGGDMIQVNATIEALRKLGVECEFSCDMHRKLDDVDLVHLVHLNFGWTKHQYDNCMTQNKPYVITTLFYDTDELGVSKVDMAQILKDAKAVICNSVDEQLELIRWFGQIDNLFVIKNSVSDIFYNNKTSGGGYVLSVGRFEHFKGHIRVVEACIKLNIPVIVVGSLGDQAYLDVLNKLQEDNPRLVTIMRDIAYESMPGIYENAQVLVSASTSERDSLVLLEGMTSGCNIVATKYNRGNSNLDHQTLNQIMVDPENPDQLLLAIRKMWFRDRNYLKLKTKMIEWSWYDVANKLKQIYARTRA